MKRLVFKDPSLYHGWHKGKQFGGFFFGFDGVLWMAMNEGIRLEWRLRLTRLDFGVWLGSIYVHAEELRTCVSY